MTSVPHVCSQCENPLNPVTDENGLTVFYPIEAMVIKVYSYSECAPAWSLKFGIPVTEIGRAASN
jgi:hypothetical protein